MARLEGQVAIVTGAGSGIGRASALLFASEGAQIVHCDLAPEATNETQRLLERQGAESVALAADVSREDTAPELVRLALASFGKLTVLMNNAGTGANALTGELPLREWDRVHNVNVRAQFMLIKAAVSSTLLP